MRNRRIVDRPQTTVVGIEVRTTNEWERNADSARIPALWNRFYRDGVPDRVPHKSGDGNLIELYTDYEGDETAEYTAFIGYEVDQVDGLSEGLVSRTMPACKYLVFTSERGPVVEVVQAAWKKLWSMDSAELGEQRAFSADFELFDSRSADFSDGQVDIYLSVK